jgi:beta-lactamase regulating signal transducer with metallopeptidase domain
MSIETLALSSWIKVGGWTLLHFLWQGTAVALILSICLAVLRNASANARYVAATIALIVIAAVPPATGILLTRNFPSTPPSDGALVRLQTLNAENKTGSDKTALHPIASGIVLDDDGGRLDGNRFQGWTAERFSPILPWVILVWLFGVALFLLRLGIGLRSVRRLRTVGTAELPTALQLDLAALAQSIGVTRCVTVLSSTLADVPAAIGWLRPIILVPSSLLVGLTSHQLEAVLAHELAHIRRHDYLVNLLQSFSETFLFYHPAVWWVSRQIRIEREHACDDIAVRVTGNAILYSRTLLQIEQTREVKLPSLAVAAAGGPLSRRVHRLLNTAPQHRTVASSVFASLLLFGTLLTFCMVGKSALRTSTNELSAAGIPGKSAARKVAFTFVSLPGFRSGDDSVETLQAMNRKLLDGLHANGISAVGFVGEGMLNKGAERAGRIDLLRMWLNAGHELGTQGFMHLELYNTPVDVYEANILKGEPVTRALMDQKGLKLRYYSYPFLNTGPDSQTKHEVEHFLDAHGYTFVPETIDNMDWLFAGAYDDARRRGDTGAMQQIGSEYVPYMERMFEFYEQLSRDVEGREVPQVLLLTAASLNADYLDDLTAMLRRRGYSFITVDQALADSAFHQPDSYTGEMGISWLQRWAITKGGEFRKEPDLPPYMHQFDVFRKTGSVTKTGKTNLKTP